MQAKTGTAVVGMALIGLGFGLGYLVALQFGSPSGKAPPKKPKPALADRVTGKWKLVEQRAKEDEPDLVIEIGADEQITYRRRVTYRDAGSGFPVGRGVDTLRGEYHFIDDEHMVIEGSDGKETIKCLLRVSIKGRVLTLTTPFCEVNTYQRLE